MTDSMVKNRSGIFLPSDLCSAPAPSRNVAARYDAAQTTHENARHWAMSDGLSANAANNPGVRKKLRDRSRYEDANNSYIHGIIRTLANDTIGTGPRLQMHTGDDKIDDMLEADYEDWATAARISLKLHTMRQAKARDGESFGSLINNKRLTTSSGIQLDMQLLEAEMIASDGMTFYDPRELETDGIRVDRFGNPISYTVLPEHPGGMGWMAGLSKPITVRAEMMVHYYASDRPGQARGIPESTPALPLCAQLRDFTLSVVTAAKNIATIGGVITTNTLPDYCSTDSSGGEIEQPTPMDSISLERGMWTFMPEMWDIKQPKSEQPVSTYSEFKNELLGEIARCFNMSFNVAAGNSSSYNYASGRLDHQEYHKSIYIERKRIETMVLRRLISNWFDEWEYVRGIRIPRRNYEWFWDGFEHVDPLKSANAIMKNMQSGTTNPQREYANKGLDWKNEMSAAADAFGISLDEYQKMLRDNIFSRSATPESEAVYEAPDEK